MRKIIIAAISLLLVGSFIKEVAAQTIPEQAGVFPACYDGDRPGDICVWGGKDGDPRFHRIVAGQDMGSDRAGRLLAVIRSDNPQNPTVGSLMPLAYAESWVVTVRVEQSGLTRYVVALDYSAPNVFPWICNTTVAETICGPNLTSPYWDMPPPPQPNLKPGDPDTTPVPPPPEGACIAAPEACPGS